MKDFQVDMGEYLPLRDVVFNTLRRAILLGELEPGERLMEVQLADKLGVSRTPIREAIRKLELEGLVVMVPRKGAAVAKITEKDLQDVLEVRCSLEELAVELACERMTEEDLKRLQETMSVLRRSLENGDVSAAAEQDVKFHDVIFGATGNKRLIQMLNNLREQMYRYRVEYLKNLSIHEGLIQEHEDILDCLRKRDGVRAREAIRSHIARQEREVSRGLSQS